MDITYLGQSSFKIKAKNTTLVTDPFDPGVVGIKYPKLSEIDIVTVSHAHSDHNHLANIKDPRMVLQEPGEYEIGGVSIRGIGSFHDDKKGELRGSNTIFVFEADGLRFAHFGDLGHKLGEGVIEELGTIDVLMLPVGGFYTVDAQVAAEIVRSIEPAITIPMHYQVKGLSSDIHDKLTPVDDFLKILGMSVENLEKLSVKKMDISETESKVVVLEIKA